MASKPQSLANAFSPRLIDQAFRSFDKGTLAIVIGAWSVAILIMLFALYTFHLSSNLKQELAAAEAMEPLLPLIERKTPRDDQIQEIANRLEKSFPELKITVSYGPALALVGPRPSHFRSWMSAISYVDTIAPDYRWVISDLCVGVKCRTGTSEPMKAILKAEKIDFSIPSPKKKKVRKK